MTPLLTYLQSLLNPPSQSVPAMDFRRRCGVIRERGEPSRDEREAPLT
jgi:hypothetical protein